MEVRAALITQLQTKLRSVGTEAGQDLLDQAITDAVAVYAERRPRRAPLSLSLQAGVSSYYLPQDFARPDAAAFAAVFEPQEEPIQLYDGMGYGRGARVLPAMAASAPLALSWSIYEGYPCKLVLTPAPSRAQTVDLSYYATHEVSDQEGDTTVPKPHWPLIVTRAVVEAYEAIIRERALRPVQFEATGDGNSQRFRMADPDALQKLADACRADFDRRMGAIV